MNWLSDIMIQILNFFYLMSGNYGFAIILLTIAINFALYPLTLSSVVQMAAVQRIQPKVQELQKKHKDDAKLMQQEIMAMYKKEKINPVGGCLPTLLKIPFFIALFFALQSQLFINDISNPTKQASFLWITGRATDSLFKSQKTTDVLISKGILIKDLKKSKENGKNYYVWSPKSNINKAGFDDELKKNKINDKKLVADAENAWSGTTSLARPDPTYVFIILIALTTFLSQKTMPGSSGQNQQMAGMTYMMPFFIAFISITFASGVQLYWVVSNLVAIAQQVFIGRSMPKQETF
jgi:YidC/Oxa1 family membrane protein insertase